MYPIGLRLINSSPRNRLDSGRKNSFLSVTSYSQAIRCVNELTDPFPLSFLTLYFFVFNYCQFYVLRLEIWGLDDMGEAEKNIAPPWT